MPANSKRILGSNVRNVSYFPSASNAMEPMTRNGLPPFMSASGDSNERVSSRTVRSQSTSSGVTYTPPGFYSPPHTPSSWQIPTTRAEVYKWNAFWMNNEPRVAAGIDFYSTFPMNGFELECPNASIKEHFEKLVKKINLKFHLPQILREYFGMGDAFVMMEIDCPKCGGEGETKNGEECDHKGATWTGVSILDPLTIEVVPVPVSSGQSFIYMNPNNELKKIVSDRKPIENYNKISDKLKKLVRANQKIPLDPLTVTHFKHCASPYVTYGTSLIRRLFPTLAYKDKLRQAQWIVAERHILPIRIAKVGSDKRPATQNDIDDTQSRLAEIANDPNVTLVTYHDFEYDFVGACYSSDTEVLTADGFKKYNEINENDDIACYNSETNNLQYSKYNKKYIYDYHSSIYGPMINFKGKHYDTLVTPNHMMWANKRKWNKNENQYDFQWEKVRADNIQEFDKFLSSVEWEGKELETYPYSNIKILKDVNINDFLSFLGYYISEGSQKFSRKTNKILGSTYIYQKENTGIYYKILNNIQKCFNNKYKQSFNSDNVCQFRINDKYLSNYLSYEFGLKSYNKKLPKWILDLPKEKLAILLNAMMDGDGDIITKNNKSKNRYSTVSKQLADNVQEILLKLGYNPKISIETPVKTNKTNNPLPIYRIYWPETKTKTRDIRKRNLHYKEYNDKVWCLEVPTGLFITRRNGKIGIHGNSGKVLQLTNEVEQIENEMIDGFGITKAVLSGEGPTYANASVAIEVLITRLESVRNLIAHWIEEKVFKPISEFNGFTHKNRRGEDEYVYPTIKWDDLKLRDNSNKIQLIFQAVQAGIFSNRTFVEAMGYDFDQEISRMRDESMSEISANPALGIASGGVSGGGFAGGGPAMPMGMEGGGMPPMDLGGAGGMEGAPPGAEGGGAPAPAAGPAGPTANTLYQNYKTVVSDSKQLVTKNQRLASKKNNYYDGSVTGFGEHEILPDEPDFQALTDVTANWGKPGCLVSQLLDSNVRTAGKNLPTRKNPFELASSLEVALHKLIVSAQINSPYFVQYAVNADSRFVLDGAFPELKIAVEADGETWHVNPEQMEKDKYRDTQLASQGWIVLRFTEAEIEQQPQDVINVIQNAVRIRQESGAGKQTVSAKIDEMRKIAEKEGNNNEKSEG